MSGEKEALNPETLAKQDTLNEEQVDALHQEALEMRKNGGVFPEDKKEKKGDQKPADKKEEGEAPENDDDIDDDDPETQKSPEELEKEKKEKEAKDAEALKKANDELLARPDEELSKEEKEKKAILIRDKAEAELNQEAEAFSKEKSVSLEDAKKELISRNKIAEKYKNDPKELAKALLHSQREFSKIQNEMKQLKEAPRPSQLKPGEAIIDGKIHTAEEVRQILVTGYREEEPELTEGMDDDKVYKLAMTRLKERNDLAQKTAKDKLTVEAKDKRTKLLATISDSEKEYGELITKLVEETPDHVLMHEDWDFNDVKAWARGQYYTPEKLEEIRKDGYKKGREEAQILGVREGEHRGGGGKPPVKTTAGSQLTNAQKDRARAMYRTEGLTDEQKFEMYADFLKHQQKKDK